MNLTPYHKSEVLDLSVLPDGAGNLDTYLHQICDTFGVDNVAYAGMNPINRSVCGHVTYRDDWKRHYAENGFQEIDPTLKGAQRSVAPVDWTRLERNEDYQRVFNAARDFGIVDQGITIPVRGPYGDMGGLSVTSNLPDAHWKSLKIEFLPQLQAVAVNIHDMVITSDAFSNLLRTPTLSRREIEILQWTAAGKSHQDIGDILSISHRTVEVHLRSARHKLYALTTAQAVGRAISSGLIYPG